MNKLIIANWKMNPASIAEAEALAKATDYENLVICPPFPFLSVVASVIKKAQLGAQDLFWEGPTGPYTGEVSAAELKNLGVKYVIIGHSERRKNLGETNEVIAKKVVAAVNEGLIPIICVGETWEQKIADEKEIVLSDEIRAGLGALAKLEGCENKNIYIAYEPIWAISTSGRGVADHPGDTIVTIGFIKKLLERLNYKLDNHFIYGGSINSKNAAEFLKHEEIEGALVGGASLRPEEVAAILAVNE